MTNGDSRTTGSNHPLQPTHEANVQIENQNTPDIAPGPSTGTPAAGLPTTGGHDPRIAQRHLIALPTRLAFMRWTRGGDIPHTPAPGRETTQRAAWYGRLQHDFQSWLASGGFHQAESGQCLPK
jgi:hypothetical protein